MVSFNSVAQEKKLNRLDDKKYYMPQSLDLVAVGLIILGVFVISQGNNAGWFFIILGGLKLFFEK